MLNDDQLLALLERYYRLQEAGVDPDLLALCDHDVDVAARIRELVGGEQQIAGSVEPDRRDVTSDESLPPLPSIERYTLLHEIGRGGMATVYLAHEEPSGRPVAVKVLHPSVSSDAAIRTRFRREAEITAALDHPNIVPIFSVGEENGTLFIVMKLLEGRSLAASTERLAPRDAARIGAGIARALHQAHISGVIHRDVKPSNIILEGETPILLDFGLAFELGSEHLTRSGTAPGTLPYMSPEQLDGRSAALDPRTDVYSLGATLYEAVSGRPPFQNDHPGRLIREIVMRDPPRLSLSASERDLETILRRAMEKERERRFMTCAEFAEDLDRFAQHRAILSRRSGLPARATRLARRHRTATTFGVAAFGVIVSLILFLWVERYAFSRVFESDVARIALLLDEESDTVRARELIRSLLERDETDPRALALADRCRATETLDDFFDVIHAMADRRGVYDDADIRRAMDALDQDGGDKIRRPFSDISIAIGLFHLGEIDRSLEVVENARSTYGPRRAIVSMLALLRDQDPQAAAAVTPPAEVESPFDRADEHVQVGLIFRLAGVDTEAQLAEIDRALEIRGDHHRARQARAIYELRSDNYERALGLFMGITTPNGYRRTTRLQIAYTALLVDEIPIAENALRGVPAESRHTRFAIMQAQILRHGGRTDDLLSYLRSALEEWPSDPDLNAELGYALLSVNRTSEARVALQRAIDLGPQNRTLDRCRTQLFTLDVQEAHGRALLGQVDDRQEWIDLKSRAAELASSVTNRRAAADVLLLKSRIERDLLGDAKTAWKTLAQSLDHDPENPAARVFYALSVAEQVANRRINGTPIDLPGYEPRLILTAEYFAEETRNGQGSGVRPTLPEHREAAEYARFLLAIDRSDSATIQDALARLPEKAPTYWADPVVRRIAEALRSSAIKADENPD